MTLDEFLSMEDAPTAAEFGARIGLSEASISRIRKGEQNITREVMRRIIAESGGKVTPAALVGLHTEDTASADRSASATNADENIGAVGGDDRERPPPFPVAPEAHSSGALPSTCSTILEPQPSSAASPTCRCSSSPAAEAA